MFKDALDLCGLSPVGAADFLQVGLSDIDAWTAGEAPAPASAWSSLADLFQRMEIEADRIATSPDFDASVPIAHGVDVSPDLFPTGSIKKIYAMAVLMALAIIDTDLKAFANLGGRPKSDRRH